VANGVVCPGDEKFQKRLIEQDLYEDSDSLKALKSVHYINSLLLLADTGGVSRRVLGPLVH
jgi:hypothetical protein